MSAELNKRLLDAAYRGEQDAVRTLVSQGADVNYFDEAGYSVLLRAAQEQRSEIVAWLADHGANVNYAAPDGHTALTLLHDRRIVEKLLKDRKLIITDKLAEDLMYHFDGNQWIRNALSAKCANISAWQDSFRQLYSRILDYEGRNLYNDLLQPAIPFVRDRLASLIHLKKNGAGITNEESWDLYALSRINDQLVLSFEPVVKEPSPICPVTSDEYSDFMTEIGMTVGQEPEDFSPFFYEIVHVEPSIGRPAVIRRLWPLVTFGQLLFSRAGADIRSGSEFVKKEVGERSVLYFAHRRLHRPTKDLSAGWGSNSQWRTSFRRDYFTETEFLYNVDAGCSVADPAPGSSPQSDLSKEQRIELLTYRCWVNHRPSGEDDWYPFEDRFVEARVMPA